MALSIPQLATKLQTESDAYKFLEDLRWPNGQQTCPHCGVIAEHYFLTPKDGGSRKTTRGARSQRRVWKCRACRKQFSVLTGTIFHGSHIPVQSWVFVVFEMCSSKNGVSAREIERKYGLTAKTASFMCHRIREAMNREPMRTFLRGRVVVDETYIGGKPGNGHKNSPRETLRRQTVGQYATDKTPVVALISRETGEVRSRAIPTVTADTLKYTIMAEAGHAPTH
jgi:transposase-like protein